MKNGHWIILDELNLAPTEILEALNRVLDENRECFIPETQEVIKAHSRFLLFATQNPPGKYAGRKVLSRAFRNRFIELNFSEIPIEELEIILHKKCMIPLSYSKRMVSVLIQLQKCRCKSDIFAGKHGFITLRDLFRWGYRYMKFAAKLDESIRFFDWNQFLANQGFMLLAGRVRHNEDVILIKGILEKIFKCNISVEELKKLRRQFDDEVADILGIPTALLHGDMANLENSQKMFNSYCYQSLVKKMSDGLNFSLLTRRRYDDLSRFVIVGEGQRDKFALAESIDKLISSGSMLINEVRAELGLEAVPWGDKPLITKNYQIGEQIEKGGKKEDESNSD